MSLDFGKGKTRVPSQVSCVRPPTESQYGHVPSPSPKPSPTCNTSAECSQAVKASPESLVCTVVLSRTGCISWGFYYWVFGCSAQRVVLE